MTLPPDDAHVRVELRRLLRHELGLGELDDETLLGALGLDSLQVIVLVTEMEALFGLDIGEEELFFERNWSVAGLARLVVDGQRAVRGQS